MGAVRCTGALLILLLAASPLLEAGTIDAREMAGASGGGQPAWASYKPVSDWSLRLPKCLRGEQTPEVETPSDGGAAMEDSATPEPKRRWSPPKILPCASSANVRTKAVQEHWDISSEELIVRGKLAEGSVGNVYEAEWRGLRVAVKMLISDFTVNSTQYQDFFNEIELLSCLRHPLLVTFLGVQIEGEPPCIVTEMMEGGSIEDLYISKEKETGNPWFATRRQIHGWMSDVLRALRFLHEGSRCIIHRDIKPANIMLTKEWTWAKLGDFGLSKEYVVQPDADGKQHGVSGKAGTVRFMAPEVSSGEEYTEKADIYSLAMCLYFMVTGVKPFNDFHDQNSLARLVHERHIRPSLVNFQWPELEKIITAAWAPAADKRPSAKEMLEMFQANDVLATLDASAPKLRHNPFRSGISF
mmetsp:Transcript_20645/g.51687  ORF Transcript_20645/g.51687 Transcript_20645/m.51687 type:complete len:414 (+) Transcript_20645:71-1312(+)